MALGKTVKQLLSEMDSDELSEWYVLDRDYHILPDYYWMAAMVAQTVADANAPLKSGKNHPIENFLPKVKRKYKAQDRVAVMQAALAVQQKPTKPRKNRKPIK